MSRVAARFVVIGKVQGVFFRASTREQALALGIDGHACNCDDGSVEVVASGSPDAVKQLTSWLHRGPPQAVVEHVRRMGGPEDQVPPGFIIR